MKKNFISILILTLLASIVITACDRSSESSSNTPFLIASDPDATGCLQFAMNSSGDAFIVWRHSVGGAEILHASHSRAGSGWSEQVPISTNNSISHKTAVSESGTCFVVWRDSDGYGTQAGTNKYDPATGWGLATRMTGSIGYVSQAAIEAAPGGDAFALWTQYTTTSFYIWANRYDSASGWETPQLLESITGGSVNAPTIAADASGNAIAVWTEYNSGYQVFARRYHAGSGWDNSNSVML